MRRIAITNQKGGVGKTTTCVNLGAALAVAGNRVLMVDLDPQAHLTTTFGIDGIERPGSYELLTDRSPVRDMLVLSENGMSVIPTRLDLAGAEAELLTAVGRELILRDRLAELDAEFDYLLIDCPPSFSVLTINAMVAVTEVIVPLQAHFLGLQGVGKLLETVNLVASRLNRELKVAGFVMCMYDTGTRLAAEVEEDLNQFVSDAAGQGLPWSDAKVFDTRIRRNIKLAECPSYGQSIFAYAPTCNGAEDYSALAAEIFGLSQDVVDAMRMRHPAATADKADVAVDSVSPAKETAAAEPGESVAPIAVDEAIEAIEAIDAIEAGAGESAPPREADPHVVVARSDGLRDGVVKAAVDGTTTAKPATPEAMAAPGTDDSDCGDTAADVGADKPAPRTPPVRRPPIEAVESVKAVAARDPQYCDRPNSPRVSDMALRATATSIPMVVSTPAGIVIMNRPPPVAATPPPAAGANTGVSTGAGAPSDSDALTATTSTSTSSPHSNEPPASIEPPAHGDNGVSSASQTAARVAG